MSMRLIKGIHTVVHAHLQVACEICHMHTRAGVYTCGIMQHLQDSKDLGWHESHAHEMYTSDPGIVPPQHMVVCII